MFFVPSEWMERRIRVTLVGVGGSGSEMLDGLARIDRALRALDHAGMEVEVYDPDVVSHSNTVRQRFWPSDAGHFKSELLVHRYGTFGGLRARAHTTSFTEEALRALHGHDIDLLVTCADKAAVRDWIGRIAASELRGARHTQTLWLDLGNGARSGQVVLGHLTGWAGDPKRLPNVRELFPELADYATLDNDAAPSCSAEESLAQQDLFINRWVAIAACDMLWQLVRHGKLTYQGMFVNESGTRVRELAAEPEIWASFGLAVREEHHAAHADAVGEEQC